MGYLYTLDMEDTDINGITVYIFPLNESATKKLLWSIYEFEGSKVCECVEQLTWSNGITNCQPMQIWHNGNNAQYLRLLKQLNRTDAIKYLPIACEDYIKPEEPEILNYPFFK